MKKSIIVLAAVILALALPSVAFANDPLEIEAAAEGEGGSTADKVQIKVTGDDVSDLSGMAKLTCKQDPGPDLDEIVLIDGSGSSGCQILLFGVGVIPEVIIIDICLGTIEVTDAFGTGDGEECDAQTFASGDKQLNLTIKVL